MDGESDNSQCEMDEGVQPLQKRFKPGMKGDCVGGVRLSSDKVEGPSCPVITVLLFRSTSTKA